MNDEKVFDILMSLKEDVSSIKTDMEHIKKQNEQIGEQAERLDKLESTVHQHSINFRAIWVGLGAIISFIFLYVLAPLIVNWLQGIIR